MLVLLPTLMLSKCTYDQEDEQREKEKPVQNRTIRIEVFKGHRISKR